jgi:hypothetical protein
LAAGSVQLPVRGAFSHVQNQFFSATDISCSVTATQIRRSAHTQQLTFDSNANGGLPAILSFARLPREGVS